MLARSLPPGRGLAQKKRGWQRGVPFRWKAYTPGKACRNGVVPKTDERSEQWACGTLFRSHVMGESIRFRISGLGIGEVW
jgi:hypothetical protein